MEEVENNISPLDKNLVINFSNIYIKESVNSLENTDWIDCSKILGTNMYCTDEAAEEICSKIYKYSEKRIHFIDSGNYHYATKFFVNKIDYKFSLILFDYNSDMQIPLIHTFTSCGDWAREILENNKYLEQLILIDPSQKIIDEIEDINKECFKKLICISLKDFEEDMESIKLEDIKKDIPIYISIDKDVLSHHYAETN